MIISAPLIPELMHMTCRNADYAFAPVSKDILMDDSNITIC
ncbi:hypothetical protein [Clostridium beijerinckii]|nr:hypothetical protein [Clostridium beijerinckii]